MAGRKDIESGASYIRLYVQKSELLSGLAAGIKDVAKFAAAASAAVVGIGGAAAGAALAAIHHFAASGDEINKMADRTGASVEALSELRYAAAQSGVTLEELEQGLTQIAKKGGKGDPAANLESLADKLAAIEDPSERAKAAMDAMGDSGTRLLPLMLGGAKGVQALRKEARDLGQSFDKKAADDATAFGDAWQRVTATASGAAFSIGAALAPSATNLLEIIKQGTVFVANWVREHARVLTLLEDLTALAAAGNWAAVGRIVVAGLNVAWLESTAMFREAWIGAKFTFLEMWADARAGLGKIFISAWSDIRATFADLVAFLKSVWNGFATAVMNDFQEIQQTVGNAIIDASEWSGAVSPEFAQAWRESLNVPLDSAQANRSSASDTRQAEIEAERRASLAAIDSEDALAKQEIERRRKSEIAGASGAGGAALAAAERERVLARADLDRLLAEIKAPGGGSTALGDLANPITAPGGKSFGTFSAAAAMAAGGATGVQERIARGTEKTNKLLEQGKELQSQLLFALNGLSIGMRHP